LPEFEHYRLEDFKLGWIIGDFSPSLLHSKEIEISIKHFKKGEVESSHKQLIATEITVVVSGSIRLGKSLYGVNDIIQILPDTYADFESLTDSSLVCIKYPSLPSDKVFE
jgi:hypothetical protein